jgi:hypothetical protein
MSDDISIPVRCKIFFFFQTDQTSSEAHLRIIHTYAAPMPFLCHAVPLRVYKVWSCLIHTYHAAPVPCHDHAVLKATSQGHGTARHGNGMCELASAVQRRHVGDLPSFGFFRLPLGLPRRLLSEAYQSVKL